MAYTAERASVNQKFQIGMESNTALGTMVAATKIPEAFTLTTGIESDVKFYRGSGRKYAGTAEQNREWVTIALAGNLDFNAIIYQLSSTMGVVAPVAHGVSSTAKDWIFVPPIAGIGATPQTYTIEQGDSTRAHKYGYGLLTDFGYKGTRTDYTTDSKGIGQTFNDAITLSGGATTIPTSPVAAKYVSIYLDTTSAGIGATVLTRPLSFEITETGFFSPLWVLNRTNAAWAAHVDLAPKATGKIKLEADVNGMTLLSTYARVGTTAYIRYEAIGPVIDVTNSINATIWHDMAVKFGKISPFADDQGVFAIEYDFDIVEDAAWGNAQKFTVTNLLTAL